MGLRSFRMSSTRMSSTRLPPTTPPQSSWKRFRQSLRSFLTVSSSNPDADHHPSPSSSYSSSYSHEHEPLRPQRPATSAGEKRKSTAAGISALPQPWDMDELPPMPTPNPKRASYVPKYAASSFNSTTTPLAIRDPERAKRASMIYAMEEQAPVDVGAMSAEERKWRRRTMMV